MRWLFAVSLAALLAVLVSAQHHPLSDDFIDNINRDATTWKAGRNFNPQLPMSYVKGLMGVLRRPKLQSEKLPKLSHAQELLKDLPSEFDSRKAWPYCPSLAEIRDQGNCGSCWAISSVAVMTDRACIHSNGTRNFHYSGDDLVGCCKFFFGGGCQGGYPSSAFQHWLQTGIVSGGPYNSSQGCRPYEIPPCEHHVLGPRPNCTNDDHDTPPCVAECRSGYSVSYAKDLHKAKSAYSISNDVNQMMYEIMKNGPVTSGFDVYEDFLHYKSGVYKHTQGFLLGGHAIKILGWGEENGIKYWLCANSWNSDWGDKGFFKIMRGANECGIEDEVDAGLPAEQ